MRVRRYLKVSQLTLVLSMILGLFLAARETPEIASAAYSAKTGYPNSMASTGDSITRGFDSSFYGDAIENSWSTGTTASVNSQYLRILASNSLINGRNNNDAHTGDHMSDLLGQVMNVITQNPEYVTILLGANDACASNEASMTDVSTFRSQFQAALNVLSNGLPDARIYVSSIPDIFNLWFILKDNLLAQFAWAVAGICQSMLVDPTSTSQADADRRQRVRQRVIDYNTQLSEVCAQFIHCRFDNNALFNNAFIPSDVSGFDYFHPSVSGQGKLAAASYAATFNFTEAVAPVSTAIYGPASGGLSATLTATDNAGVAGIEYKINGGGWMRYTTPVNVAGGDLLTYRAVDVNGNIEASHALTVVTNPIDNGPVSTTLSYALNLPSTSAATKLTICFNVNNNRIDVSTKLPDVADGLRIDGRCWAGQPGVTLNYTGTQPNVSGLVLGNNITLRAITAIHFTGKQISIQNRHGNRLITMNGTK